MSLAFEGVFFFLGNWLLHVCRLMFDRDRKKEDEKSMFRWLATQNVSTPNNSKRCHHDIDNIPPIIVSVVQYYATRVLLSEIGKAEWNWRITQRGRLMKRNFTRGGNLLFKNCLLRRRWSRKSGSEGACLRCFSLWLFSFPTKNMNCSYPFEFSIDLRKIVCGIFFLFSTQL